MGLIATKTTPEQESAALSMLAAGKTQAVVAKALGMSTRTLQRMIAEPLAKQRLAELRRVIRVKTLEGARATAPKAQKWLQRVVEEQQDPRAADQLSRAVLNMEKTAASAAGETEEKSAQVGVVVQIAPYAQGAGQTVPVQQAKVLSVTPAKEDPWA